MSAGNNDMINEPSLSIPSYKTLKIYLQYDFIKFNAKQARELFDVPFGHGQIVTPNWRVHGGSRNISNRIKALEDYFALCKEEQQAANKTYSIETSAFLKKIHKENYKFLDSRVAKETAIANQSQGDMIALDINWETPAAIENNPTTSDESGPNREAANPIPTVFRITFAFSIALSRILLLI